jgi:murein DD-endopeptidase
MLLPNLFVTLVLIGNGDPVQGPDFSSSNAQTAPYVQVASALRDDGSSVADSGSGPYMDCTARTTDTDSVPSAREQIRLATTELLALVGAERLIGSSDQYLDCLSYDSDAEWSEEEEFTSYDTHGDLVSGVDALASTEMEWSRHAIQRGETLSGLWNPVWNLPTATLYRLLEDRDSARALNRLRVGQEIEWRVDPEGKLERLRLWTSASEGMEWVRRTEEHQFDLARIRNQSEITHIVVSSEVRGNVSSTLAEIPELSRSGAAALSVLLDRHLPLRERAREGDEFTLLIEQERLSGDTDPHAVRLLAFDYRGQSLNMTAARHSNGRYYRPDGTSLLPPFDRRPFSGSYRISSSFDTRRRHPVTGRVAPHNGTDFAMPVGTPIVAPADGVVTRVDYGPYNGRFIVLSHGQGYSTVYLHLQRALVQQGQRIERGQRIALSGNTGRTTGPHLHYELHVNGRPVDAMRAELPSSDSLTGDELRQFQASSATLLSELRRGTGSRQVAMQP